MTRHMRDMFNIEKEKQLAVAASESKAQFLANMSHEIRTPINTVIGMNEMILRENKDENIDESVPAVLKGDEVRIKQILYNLLSNAIKYTEKGFVTFSVKGVHSEDGFAMSLSVKDTGIGIKKKDMDKLWQLLYRSNSATGCGICSDGKYRAEA